MRFRRSQRIGGARLLVLLAISAGCYANPLVPTSEVAWVTTLVDSTTSALASARTFALPDTVVELPGDLALDHSVDAQITQHVREHLLALGWTEQRDPSVALPDVVVVVGAMSRVEIGVSYTNWFGAWGWMPYWGTPADPSWIWGAPVGGIPYMYEVGTLVMTMVDLRTPRATASRVPLLWVAAVNAAMASGAPVSRARDGIDQAFAQSPYLRIP